jgi:tetratricopeptide (TPR) repeat protein
MEQQDLGSARVCYEESRTIEEQIGNREGIAEALQRLAGIATSLGDYREARRLYELALAQYRELGDKKGMAVAHQNIGHAASNESNLEVAESALAASLGLRREIGDERGVAAAAHDLAFVAWSQGRFERALTLLGESLAIWQRRDDAMGISLFLQGTAWRTAVWPWRPWPSAGQEDWRTGETEVVIAEYPSPATQADGNGSAPAPGDRRPRGLPRDPRLAERLRSRLIVAIRLLGADQAWREARSLPPTSPKIELDVRHAATLVCLGDETIDTAWTEGASLSIDQAIALALAALKAPVTALSPVSAPRNPSP